MKSFLISLVLISSTASFAKTLSTPKLPYGYEVCEARHAGNCEEKASKAVISCESDLDQVCRTMDSDLTKAVPESLKCKQINLGLGHDLKTVGIEILSVPFNIYIWAGECDFGKSCQMQQQMSSGDEVPFYKINAEGKKELDAEWLVSKVDSAIYGDTRREGKTKYISSLKCE